MAVRVDLLAELSSEDEAMQIYDMEVRGLGVLRVAEHLTVKDGAIVRLRQIHDTMLIRAMGLGGDR
jgi:hypothetical protein